MSNPPLTAPIDASLPPPLHELDWQKFERLTVDLYAFEPDVATSDPYGKSGQAQYGIDVIARRVRADARATFMEIVTDCALIDRVGGAGDWRPEPGEAVFELVETAVILANRAERPDAEFADPLATMGRTWPALAPHLADTLSNVIATTRSSRVSALWRAWLILRSIA